MKKSCIGCKAISDTGFCKLGYDNKVTFMTVEGEQKSRYYPAEDCDRPETLKEYHNLQAKRSTDFYNGKRVKLRGSTSENS